MNEERIISSEELDIPERLKEYLMRTIELRTVGGILANTREDLQKKWSLTNPQIDAIFNAINKIKVEYVKEELSFEEIKTSSPRIDEIIKRVAEHFKIPESSATSKVMSKGAQMVLTVLFEDNESIDKAAIEEMERRKASMDEQVEKLAQKQVEYDKIFRAVDEQKTELEKKKEMFEEVRAEFEKFETAEARDRVRMLEIYNNIIWGENKNVD